MLPSRQLRGLRLAAGREHRVLLQSAANSTTRPWRQCATPQPADEGDLRHILGAALICAAAVIRDSRAGEAVTLLKALGNPQRFTERDGAVECFPG